METTYGKRIYTKVNRPDRALVEAFRGIPSSNIADMMNRMYNMYGDLRCYTKNASMVGTAITVHCSEGDNALLHRAMDMAEPGDVIVLNGGGCMSRALCGEIMFNYAHSKGIAGFVLDGCIRDADALDALGKGSHAARPVEDRFRRDQRPHCLLRSSRVPRRHHRRRP